MGDILKTNYENTRIEVDMSKYTSDEARDLRSKLRDCQSQMDYLGYKHGLILKEYNKLRDTYDVLIGVKDDKSV